MSAHIYICRDKDGQAVYVGQSVDWKSRMLQHQGRSWYGDIVDVETIPAPEDRTERLAVEAEYIRTLAPRGNIVHHPENEPEMRQRQGATLRQNAAQRRAWLALPQAERDRRLAAWDADIAERWRLINQHPYGSQAYCDEYLRQMGRRLRPRDLRRAA